MTGASSLAFPGSRKLANWWRQLVPYQPQAVWVAHLLVHQVEALVRLSQRSPVDPFTLFLLDAVSLSDHVPAVGPFADPLACLDESLRLGRQVLRQALQELEGEGLVQQGAGGRWALTALGRQALESKTYTLARHERRAFHFVEPPGKPNGNRRPPHFLDLHNSTGIPWPVAEDRGFDVHALKACLGQPDDWKLRHGFPVEVQEILGAVTGPAAGPTAAGPPAWQRVIVDKPEWILAVLVRTALPERGPLMGLAVRQEGWVLLAGDPLFTVGDDWPEIFPELAQEPAAEIWRQAWRAWCEPRSIPPDEVEACRLEPRGGRLRVVPPARLMERLRATRSDALKGEAWLLAGEGRVRTAAPVEVVAAASA